MASDPGNKHWYSFEALEVDGKISIFLKPTNRKMIYVGLNIESAKGWVKSLQGCIEEAELSRASRNCPRILKYLEL